MQSNFFSRNGSRTVFHNSSHESSGTSSKFELIEIKYMLNIYFLNHAYHISSAEKPVTADDFYVGCHRKFPLPHNVLMDNTGLENGSPETKMHILPSGVVSHHHPLVWS